MAENHTYIHIITNTLQKKLVILDEIIKLTLSQEGYINESSLSLELFDETVLEKDVLLKKLEELDNGFDKLYEHVKEELQQNKMNYKAEILTIQECIKKIIDKSVKLRALENSVNSLFKVVIENRKLELKTYKLNTKNVNQYDSYRNKIYSESYFFDKKK